PESDRYLFAIQHAPAGGGNLDRLPALVRQVDVNLAVGAADARVNLALRSIEVCSGLAQPQRGLQRLAVRRGAGGLVVDAHQPASASPSPDGPGRPGSTNLAVDIGNRI